MKSIWIFASHHLLFLDSLIPSDGRAVRQIVTGFHNLELVIDDCAGHVRAVAGSCPRSSR
jgi:hypothetical protein